jgi:hypothetical protein
MDEALKAKLHEARERFTSQQAGINTNRKHDDPARREWSRGKQRTANAERLQFRNSLTDEERTQIEERIKQLVNDNPALSSTNTFTLDSKKEQPSASVEVLDGILFSERHRRLMELRRSTMQEFFGALSFLQNGILCGDCLRLLLSHLRLFLQPIL